MKKIFLPVVMLFLIFFSCKDFAIPGFGDEEEKGNGLEVVISLYRTDSSGLPAFPFIHSDSASAGIEIAVIEYDIDGTPSGYNIVENRTVSLTDRTGYASAYFEHLPEGSYQIWVTTFSADGEVRSFGTAEADLTGGGATEYARLAPAVNSFAVIDGTQTVFGDIRGPYIDVILPDGEFAVSGWTAQSSRGSDNNIWVSGGVYPEGGGWIPAETSAGMSIVDDSGISVTDYSLFSSAVGTPDEFHLGIQALNSAADGKVIGRTDYLVRFSYSGKPELERVEPPLITPESGTYTGSQEITISSEQEGVTLWYTYDGSNPGIDNRIPYSGPITVSESTIIRAVAIMEGMDDSIIVSREYELSFPKTEEPWFSPSGGTFDYYAMVEIYSSTSEAEIWFTTDGSEPDRDTGNGSVYEYGFEIHSSTAVKAVAYGKDMEPSEAVSSYFEILEESDAPVFSLGDGDIHNTG